MPLEGFRVLDLTSGRAGPTCVRQLADWGADVVTVEAPLSQRADTSSRQGSDFENLRRNTRSITLDIKSAAGKAVLVSLLRRTDVLVESMRPKVKARLGISYDIARELNARIVYASLSGYGQDGPYADRAGADQVAQGVAGLMSVNGFPTNEPVRVGVPIADLAAGLYLAIGVLAALVDRERTGRGRWVRTSLFEAAIGILDHHAVRWTIDHKVSRRSGNLHPTLAAVGCFATRDGHVNVACAGDRLWTRFCETVGAHELLEDARFASESARMCNRDAVNELVAQHLAERSTAEWVATLNETGVSAGPVNTLEEVFDDPQVQHLGMVQHVIHRTLGQRALIRSPVSMTDTPSTVRRPGPEPGEHTVELLRELGIGDERIAELREEGTI